MDAAAATTDAEPVDANTFAIVGANLAGGRAAIALRSEGYDGRLVLIGDEAYPPYERPPLSKEVLKGAKTPESTFLQSEDSYRDANIELRLFNPFVYRCQFPVLRYLDIAVNEQRGN